MSTFHNAGEFIGANIEFFSIFSLIDFSDSDMGANATPYKGDGTKLDLTDVESKPYHQAQNLNILIQSIGFRCQPAMISVNSQSVTITSFNNVSNSPFNGFLNNFTSLNHCIRKGVKIVQIIHRTSPY